MTKPNQNSDLGGAIGAAPGRLKIGRFDDLPDGGEEPLPATREAPVRDAYDAPDFATP